MPSRHRPPSILPILFAALATVAFPAALPIKPVPPCEPGPPAADPGYSLEKSASGASSAPFDSVLLDPLPAYAQIRYAIFSGWADTGLYVGTQMGAYPQLHQVSSPGADRRQLTFFPGRTSGFYLNPDPHRRNFLYTEDRGGDEDFRLRLRDLETGADRPSGAPPGRVDGIVWNDSGTAFAYSHTPAGTDRWDLRLGRLDGSDTLLLSRPGTWAVLDIRPDGKRLLVQRYVSASEAELFALDVATGNLTRLAGGGKPAYADNALWIRTTAGTGASAGAGSVAGRGAGDGAGRGRDSDSAWAVVFTSDRDGEFHRLYRVRADSGSKPEAWSEAAPWDVEWVSIAPDRRTLVYSLNEEGYSRLYLRDPRRKRAIPLKNIPQGVIRGVTFRPGRGERGAREFAFTLNASTAPGDAYSYDIPRAKATRWTYSEPGGLDPARFRTPELIRYPSFDSLPGGIPRTIPAWLYRPDSAAFPGPRPVVVLIHGGPEMQARPWFDPFLQYLVGRLGFIVAEPNVRGSSGYGRSWQQADDGFRRMGSVRDVGALIEWIRSRPAGEGFDTARMAVSGRSYGGFMSLSTLVEYGRFLRAGISTVGISHFPTFLKKTSGYRRDLRRAEYGDERIPRMAAFLDSISPLTRADRIATPLLLCHGRNDPRVPYGESERIFTALKARKVPVWFLTFAEEGHAVRDQDSRLVEWRTQAEFLARELGTSRPNP